MTAAHPPALKDARSLRRAARAFVDKPRLQTLSWSRARIRDQDGRPYDHEAYPYFGAPGGPMDEFDNPANRTISLQAGSRVGKTVFAQCCLLKTADIDSAPMMLASSVEQTCLDVLARMYGMIRNSGLQDLLRRQNENDQKQNRIEFTNCRLHGAWARSVSTLADKDICVGVGNELDKWEHLSTSKEAHPLKLFTDRFKNYQSIRKVLFESTPTIKGKSLIERLLLAGTNCRYNVPCPHCGRYQPLAMGRPDTPHGVRWQTPERGRCSPEMARSTAYYQCAHGCPPILDEDRQWMISRGVWCPAGCTVKEREALKSAENLLLPDDDKKRKPHVWTGWPDCPWIAGEPHINGPDASYQLSSLYATSLTWGDIAAEFVGSASKPQELRNFVNQWEGLTWEFLKSKSTAETLMERCGTVDPLGTIPQGGLLLTVVADRQRADGGFIVWTVVAHGAEERAWLVDRGTCDTLAELWGIITRAYPHADGGLAIVPHMAAVDSGDQTKATYDWCLQHPGRVLPIKGDDRDMQGRPYELSRLDGKGRTGSTYKGMHLLHVNTDYWETELQARLDERPAGAPGSLSIPGELAADIDFLEDLLNGTQEHITDKRSNTRLLWVKRHDGNPNDYRDTVRYSLCLCRAWLDAHANRLPVRLAPGLQPRPAETPAPAFVRQPQTRSDGGWIRGRGQ